MARNKSASPVPSWFNLAAYDYLGGLDASGWLNVLEALLILLNYDARDFTEDASRGTVALDELEDAFLQFQAGPSQGGLDRWKRRYSINPATYEFGTTRSLSTRVVARMGATLERLDGGRRYMGNMRRLVAKEQDKDYSYVAVRRARQRVDDCQQFATVPFFVAVRDSSLRGESGGDLTTDRAISVDMSAPDDIILADFKSWLREMRKLEHHRAARRSFTATDYQKWVRNAYVPLLVLDKWKKLSSAKLTQGDICDAAFPSGQRVEVDDLRKTLLPNASSWASGETVMALAAQAAREATPAEPEESRT